MSRDGLRDRKTIPKITRPTNPSFIIKRKSGAIAPSQAILGADDATGVNPDEPSEPPKKKAKTTKGDIDARKELERLEKQGIYIQLQNEHPHPNHLLVSSLGPRILDRFPFCSGCRNGGDLHMCTKCSVRGYCEACLDVTRLAEDVKFECPHCWTEGNVHNKRYPYPLALKPTNMRDSWLICDTSSVAVLDIRLTSVRRFDSPAYTVYLSLGGYIYGNAVYLEIDFNFEDLSSRRDYERRLKHIINMLSPGGSLSHIKRFMVFISTHSHPETGDLHFISNNRGCTSFDQFISHVLPQNFLDVVRGLADCPDEEPLPLRSVCVVSACGGLLRFREPVKSLIEFAKSSGFSDVLTFTQMDFQAAFSYSFLKTYSENYFVHHKLHPEQSLLNCPDFGAHSGLVRFNKSGKATHYFWTHKTIQPLGQPVAMQCPDCQRLKTWKPVVAKMSNCKPSDTHALQCQAKGCSHITVIEGFDVQLSKQLKSTGSLDAPHGAWLYGPFEIPTTTVPLSRHHN